MACAMKLVLMPVSLITCATFVLHCAYTFEHSVKHRPLVSITPRKYDSGLARLLSIDPLPSVVLPVRVCFDSVAVREPILEPSCIRVTTSCNQAAHIVRLVRFPKSFVKTTVILDQEPPAFLNLVDCETFPNIDAAVAHGKMLPFARSEPHLKLGGLFGFRPFEIPNIRPYFLRFQC
jgi:hypothetical protein